MRHTSVVVSLPIADRQASFATEDGVPEPLRQTAGQSSSSARCSRIPVP